MNGNNVRPGLWARLRGLVGHRHAEPSLRASIAELVQEAAEAQAHPGEPPELDRHERLLIANVLRLRETTAADVMVPRADIIALAVDATLAQTIELFRTDGHSRLPVYREELDDVVGMVHLKDVFAYVGRPEAFSIEAIMRKPLLVAPQLTVLDLLAQMRQARMHMALVVDEYGGIDGLVTIEDLVETITGDIADEHDDADAPMVTGAAGRLAGRERSAAGGGVRGEAGSGAERGRAGLGHPYGGRAGVHSGRAGAGEGGGGQPPVGAGVPGAGCGPSAYQAGAGAAASGGGGGAAGAGGGGVGA